MQMAKLDSYDYELFPGIIRIAITSNTDPDLVDIMTEINRSNGRIYIDGVYYSYLDYSIFNKHGASYIELEVDEC